MYICICIDMYMYVRIYMYICVYVFMCVCTHIYIYIYIYIIWRVVVSRGGSREELVTYTKKQLSRIDPKVAPSPTITGEVRSVLPPPDGIPLEDFALPATPESLKRSLKVISPSRQWFPKVQSVS